MNKQELIERIEGLNKLYGENKNYVSYDDVFNLVKQLDEPQKVQVPQFVADWYEKNKSNLDYNIWNYVCEWEDLEESEFKNWFNNSNMHQFGYTVEKEKRYSVKMHGIEGNNSHLKYNKNMGHWYFGSLFIYNNDVDTRTYHTRKELEKAGFGWVFDCPGIEVKEVKE